MTISNSFHMCVDVNTSEFPFFKDQNYFIQINLYESKEKSSVFYTQFERSENENRLTREYPMIKYPNRTICLALPSEPNCEESIGSGCFKCKS
jgi:hypothetical protein